MWIYTMNYEFYTAGRLIDYRISLFLKGERLFYAKNMQLFDDNSQENTTTIPRLSAGRSYAYSSRNTATIADLY